MRRSLADASHELRTPIAALQAGGEEDGEVRVELWHSPTHVRVSVSDDGPGVPLAERERIFDGFVRLNGTPYWNVMRRSESFLAIRNKRYAREKCNAAPTTSNHPHRPPWPEP